MAGGGKGLKNIYLGRIVVGVCYTRGARSRRWCGWWGIWYFSFFSTIMVSFFFSSSSGGWGKIKL